MPLADKQDKRSLVLIEREIVDRWLPGTLDDAKGLLVLTPVERFLAGPYRTIDARSAAHRLKRAAKRGRDELKALL